MNNWMTRWFDSVMVGIKLWFQFWYLLLRSSYWRVRCSTLLFDVRFVGSDSACDCSCHGRHSCELFSSNLVCVFVLCGVWFWWRSSWCVSECRRKLLWWYRPCSLSRGWLLSCILLLAPGYPWFRALLLFIWRRRSR